jgi:hypothetical protein
MLRRQDASKSLSKNEDFSIRANTQEVQCKRADPMLTIQYSSRDFLKLRLSISYVAALDFRKHHVHETAFKRSCKCAAGFISFCMTAEWSICVSSSCISTSRQSLRTQSVTPDGLYVHLCVSCHCLLPNVFAIRCHVCRHPSLGKVVNCIDSQLGQIWCEARIRITMLALTTQFR